MSNLPTQWAKGALRLAIVAISLSLLSFATEAAQPAAAPISGYTLLETVTVPVDGSSVWATTSLVNGIIYKVRALGTFNGAGSGNLGDAEYGNFSNPPGSVEDNCYSDPNGTDLGIGINDTLNDNSKNPHWGAYSASHSYVVELAGQGATIGLNYHDCYYPDNSGSLTVEIWQPNTSTGTATRTPSKTPTRTRTPTRTSTVTPSTLVPTPTCPYPESDPRHLECFATSTSTKTATRTATRTKTTTRTATPSNISPSATSAQTVTSTQTPTFVIIATPQPYQHVYLPFIRRGP